ncbi:unnamed protein product [Arctogadus glacialis]
MMGIAEEGNRLGRGQDGNKLTRLKTKVHAYESHDDRGQLTADRQETNDDD